MTDYSITSPNLWTLRPAYGYSGRYTPTITNNVIAVVAHNDYIYTGANGGATLAHRVIKDTMIDSGVSATLTGNVAAMCYDPSNDHIIVVTTESPARIYELGLDMTIVGSLVLAAGEDTVTQVIHDGTYCFVLCGTSPTKVVVLNTNPATPVRLGGLTLNAGENGGRSIDYDGANSNVYIGLPTSPGKIVKVNNAAGTLTRVSVLNLSIGGIDWNVCGAVAYDRYNSGGLLYALASGGGQLEILFQINPSNMTLINAIGGRHVGFTFTGAVLDTISTNAGKYLYATLYDTDTGVGWLEAWDIGSQGGGMRSSRRFSLNNPDAIPRGLAFDGTYVYLASNTIAGVGSVIKFDKTFIGLTLYLRPGYTWSHPIFGESFPIIGLDNPITRMYGVHGRVSSGMVHLVVPKNTFTATRKQAEEDLTTILNCKPFGFLKDWGEYGRAVSLLGSAPQIRFMNGPQVSDVEITFQVGETAI